MKYTAAPSVIYVDDWFKSTAYWFCFVLPGWVFFYLSLCVSFKLFLSWILAVCHVHLFIDLVVEFWYCCALFYTFLRAKKKKKKKSNEKKKIMIKEKEHLKDIVSVFIEFENIICFSKIQVVLYSSQSAYYSVQFHVHMLLIQLILSLCLLLVLFILI